MQRNKILKFNWVKLDRLLVKQIQLDEDFELLNYPHTPKSEHI